ncbi:MAG: sigma-70 family RNA polymerase sigma factor [bacterium]|nr:sigma-70 family RNA polymerase sigma factor [bacterium]
MPTLVNSIGRPAAAVETDRQESFNALVRDHRDRAVALAWRMVGGDGAAAEDVAQEAFVRAHRALGQFRGQAQLSTWFTRILLNEANRYLRWRWVRQRRAAEMPDDPEAPSSPPGDPMLRGRIAQALEKLSRGQREAFVLIHLEGYTVRETAEITGRAPGTIKSHLHRALKALRSELSDLAPTDPQELVVEEEASP